RTSCGTSTSFSPETTPPAAAPARHRPGPDITPLTAMLLPRSAPRSNARSVLAAASPRRKPTAWTPTSRCESGDRPGGAGATIEEAIVEPRRSRDPELDALRLHGVDAPRRRALHVAPLEASARGFVARLERLARLDRAALQ